jgi:hypothetical protein
MVMLNDAFGPGENLASEGKFEVTAPSGSIFYVLTQEEADYFKDKANRYQQQNHFQNISDIQDLDRILFMETLVWRWGSWLAQECDYWGGSVDLLQLKRFLNEFSHEIRLLKKTLGIDKAARDREKGERVSDYLENLRMRAKEFGVHRDEQHSKAITLFMELRALVQLYENCDEREREEQNVEMKDVIEWIQKIAVPEFEQIDVEFRKKQRTWIKEL